ncbi:MAG: DNA-binding protein [Blastocatellia bacterium AA13]|nr:MAG: DNA-binding protein [Blastocatellia bacterium AA13]
MKPITREWIDKAEADWNSAGLLFRSRKYPDYSGSCFHAQQSAEKYLKAKLVEADIYFSKTHNLIALLTLVLTIEPSWSLLQPQLRALNAYAIEYRYPGNTAVRDDARDAIIACNVVRATVRRALGLKA